MPGPSVRRHQAPTRRGVPALAPGYAWTDGRPGLSWVLADRSRLSYGIPMAIGLVGAPISVALLLAGSLL